MKFIIVSLFGGRDFDRGPEWRAMYIRRQQVQDLAISMLSENAGVRF